MEVLLLGFVDNVLEQRNVNRELLKEIKVPKLDWEHLDEVAKKFVMNVIIKKQYKQIGILYDTDVDGLFSGFTIEDFLRRTTIPKEKIHRYMNQMKNHGATEEMVAWVLKEDIDTLFIVDAGSSDVTYLHEQLPHVNVIILDHHPYTKSEIPENIELLNVSDYDHLPALSGCGVVYRFVEIMGNMLNIDTEMYETYVGMTVLSDICSMLEPENRYYVRQAYANYQSNGFLRAFGFFGSYKSFFSYQIIPYLNALIRCGETDWAMTIVNNMDDFRVTSKVVEDSKRIKAKQANYVKQVLASGQVKMADGCVVHIRHDHKELKPMNGLLGNMLLGEYDCSALVLTLDKETKTWGGSFRGKNFSNDLLQQWGFTCAGHDKACGAVIDHEGLLNFLTNFKLIAEEPKPSDIVADIEALTYDDFMDIAQFNEMANGDLETILVELTNEPSEYHLIPSNKRDYYRIGNNKIVDFTFEPLIDNVKVEPSLDKTGYQLIRN